MIPLGLLDDPESQSQPELLLRPSEHGSLVVLGGPRSGRSTLLHLVAEHSGGAVIPGEDVEAAWDAVVGHPAGVVPEPLLLDDLDALVTRFADEATLQHFVSALARMMRRCAGAGHTIVCSAGRWGPALSALTGAVGSRLHLRHPTMHDHVLAGLTGSAYDPHAVPGRGWWNGLRVQTAMPAAGPYRRRNAECPRLERAAAGSPLAVITGAPWRLRENSALSAVPVAEWGGEPDPREHVVFAEPSGWLSRPTAFSAIRARRALLFHECTPADLRALLRTKTPPPALIDGAERAWLATPDGRVRRVSMGP